jgi:hypothetical protein
VHPACATAAYSGVLVAALALSACGGSNDHVNAKAQAAAACQDYFSVNGMTGDEGRATYRAGSRLAAAAASADRTWQPLATAFTEMSKFNDDIAVAGQIPAQEEPAGTSATRTVADICAKLLGRHG